MIPKYWSKTLPAHEEKSTFCLKLTDFSKKVDFSSWAGSALSIKSKWNSWSPNIDQKRYPLTRRNPLFVWNEPISVNKWISPRERVAFWASNPSETLEPNYWTKTLPAHGEKDPAFLVNEIHLNWYSKQHAREERMIYFLLNNGVAGTD